MSDQATGDLYRFLHSSKYWSYHWPYWAVAIVTMTGIIHLITTYLCFFPNLNVRLWRIAKWYVRDWSREMPLKGWCLLILLPFALCKLTRLMAVGHVPLTQWKVWSCIKGQIACEKKVLLFGVHAKKAYDKWALGNSFGSIRLYK